jgi:hypothetical protein
VRNGLRFRGFCFSPRRELDTHGHSGASYLLPVSATSGKIRLNYAPRMQREFRFIVRALACDTVWRKLEMKFILCEGFGVPRLSQKSYSLRSRLSRSDIHVHALRVKLEATFGPVLTLNVSATRIDVFFSVEIVQKANINWSNKESLD